MTGTPKNGVTTLSGIRPASPGKVQMILHSKARAAPVKSVTGKRALWFVVCNSSRAICGTANPMNEIGPQYAVTIAVRIPVISNNKVRVRRILIPRFAAYPGPSNIALSGFANMRALPMPVSMTKANAGR